MFKPLHLNLLRGQHGETFSFWHVIRPKAQFGHLAGKRAFYHLKQAAANA